MKRTLALQNRRKPRSRGSRTVTKPAAHASRNSTVSGTATLTARAAAADTETQGEAANEV